MIKILLAAVVLGALGCGPLPPPARPAGLLVEQLVANCYSVDGHLFRSAQPAPAQLPALELALGITLVIQLDGEARDDVHGRARTLEAPLPGVVGEPTTQQLGAILDAIDREIAGGGRVLIHCLHGEDRTGLIAALYRVRHGATPEFALGEALHHGFHPTLPGLWRAWLGAVNWSQPPPPRRPS